VPDPAVDADVPACLFDEAVDHAQPEAAALSHLLRREERFEHPLHDLGSHAGPGVGDGEQHVLAGRHLLVLLGIILVEDSIARLQRERAGAPHGIPRIDREVDQRLFQFSAVGECLPQARS
jgi:hypothetical protein